MQLRFAERVTDVADLSSLAAQGSPQQVTQDPMSDNEAPPVALESKARAPVPFVVRERGGETGERLGCNVQMNGPALDVHHSASATTTSRGPSKGSRPCAVRMLSTTSKSPACQRSRVVCASYTSLITRTTSASIGSPFPKRVLNGSPSAPYSSTRYSRSSGAIVHSLRNAT